MLRGKMFLVAVMAMALWSTHNASAELIGYWSLSGNANDQSSYGNNGTGTDITYTSDVPTAISSYVSTSAYFNGSSSKVLVPYTSSLYTNSAVTISFWVKAAATEQTGGYRRIFSNISGTSNGFEFQEAGTSSDLSVRIDTSKDGTTFGFNQTKYIGDALDGSWHFVAITADSSGALTTYYDGKATGQSFTYVSGFGSATALCFGNSMNESSDWLKGYISNAAMWNTVLTAAQIKSLYNGTATPLTVAVPEPSTTVMALTGVAGLLAFAWRKRRRK